MSAETLLTAARRVVRFHAIDEAHGALTSRDTLQAMFTLQKQIDAEEARLRSPPPTLRQRLDAFADDLLAKEPA